MLYNLKLETGEEVLSVITNETDDKYFVLENPRIVGMVNAGEIGLFPFMFGADPSKNIKLSKDKVMAYTTDIRDNMQELYRSQTSRILTPKILLG